MCNSCAFLVQMNSCLPEQLLPGKWITGEESSCYPNSSLPGNLWYRSIIFSACAPCSILMVYIRNDSPNCIWLYGIDRVKIGEFLSSLLGLFQLFPDCIKEVHYRNKKYCRFCCNFRAKNLTWSDQGGSSAAASRHFWKNIKIKN